jgi:hypothetical protein
VLCVAQSASLLKERSHDPLAKQKHALKPKKTTKANRKQLKAPPPAAAAQPQQQRPPLAAVQVPAAALSSARV